MAISAVGDEIRRQRMSRPGQEAGTTAADVSNFVLEESGAGSLVTLPQGDSSEAVREAIAVTLHPMSPLRRVIVQLSPRPRGRKHRGS